MTAWGQKTIRLTDRVLGLVKEGWAETVVSPVVVDQPTRGILGDIYRPLQGSHAETSLRMLHGESELLIDVLHVRMTTSEDHTSRMEVLPCDLQNAELNAISQGFRIHTITMGYDQLGRALVDHRVACGAPSLENPKQPVPGE